MISEQIIANCIEEIHEISGVGMIVTDPSGKSIASSGLSFEPEASKIRDFAQSDEETGKQKGLSFHRIRDEKETAYVLICEDKKEENLCAKLAAVQIKNLIIAYRDRNDRNTFYQDVLLDNILLVDLYNRAQKLSIITDIRRCVFVMEPAAKEKMT